MHLRCHGMRAQRARHLYIVRSESYVSSIIIAGMVWRAWLVSRNQAGTLGLHWRGSPRGEPIILISPHRRLLHLLLSVHTPQLFTHLHLQLFTRQMRRRPHDGCQESSRSRPPVPARVLSPVPFSVLSRLSHTSAQHVCAERSAWWLCMVRLKLW